MSKARVVHESAEYTGIQGPRYRGGVSAESTGSEHLWLGRVTLGPGARTGAHLHEHHETAIYVVSGAAVLFSGPELADRVEAGAGDYLYIPASTSHLAMNPSAPEPLVAVIARTDPHEQESVVLQPELDAKVR
ncbi:MAG: cupin domain-containing protein [Candidatus Limnocylindrales bacterium]